MTKQEVKPLPRLWFLAGMLAAVGAAGNLSLWIFGLFLPHDEPLEIFTWWMQLFLAVLLGASAPYYFWRSRQDRRRLEAPADHEAQ